MVYKELLWSQVRYQWKFNLILNQNWIECENWKLFIHILVQLGICASKHCSFLVQQIPLHHDWVPVFMGWVTLIFGSLQIKWPRATRALSLLRQVLPFSFQNCVPFQSWLPVLIIFYVLSTWPFNSICSNGALCPNIIWLYMMHPGWNCALHLVQLHRTCLGFPGTATSGLLQWQVMS